MKSLRLPKRLTMHGDDEKDHMFLVRAKQQTDETFHAIDPAVAELCVA